MEVKVAYAPSIHEQAEITLHVAAGATVEQVIAQANLSQHLSTASAVGIWGKVCELTQPVQAGDRVEIYRALKVDPKELRRQKAERDK